MTGLERYEERKNSCTGIASQSGSHCNHWDEGDGDCDFCGEQCWCPDEGEDCEFVPR